MKRWLIATAVTAAVPITIAATASDSKEERAALIARSQVWMPTDIPAMDLRTGPVGPGSFEPGTTVTCEYVDRDLRGASPKFACRLPEGDEVKVKYGAANAEVYGEVAASRLLWALGFVADRMYPVRVVCRGCPRSFGGLRPDGDRLIDPAAIERKTGRELLDGWSWDELDRVDESKGGAPRAHRDALKLVAALLQHSDSRAIQQRVICLDEGAVEGAPCDQPLMMINDLGLTFGKAAKFNQNQASMNLEGWLDMPVWRGDTGCVANLRRSFTGTIKHPAISEEGRQFLADLLVQLSDEQLHAMFDVARVHLRPRETDNARSGYAAAAEWVTAFKQKRSEIVERRCAA
jgi:hypothetical protein